MAQARIKNNLPDEKKGLFNRLPLSIYRKRLSPSSVAFAGKIFTFTDNVGEHDCRLTYDVVREEFGVCRQTIANGIKRLSLTGQISRIDRDMKGTAFRYIGDLQGKQYDVVPQYFYTAEICLRGEDLWRKMTHSEIRVLARMMTACADWRNGGNARSGGGIYKASLKELSRVLGLSETSVKRAIYALMRARLIFREKGKNRFKNSEYRVASCLYEYQGYQKKTKKQRKETVSAQAEAVNARAERERYYAKLQELAQNRVDKYMAIANKNARFRAVTLDLSKLELAMAKAELYDVENVAALRGKKMALQAERRQLLVDMNLSEELLRPNWKCRYCEDTGYLPNGKQCTCFPVG